VDITDDRARRVRGNSAATVAAAQLMRREMTPAEAALWERLRGKRLRGLRFRAQHPVGPFILDFYCPSAKLVVEVDGPVHEDRGAEDAARTEQLNAFGYRVIRFANDEVLGDIDRVLARIAEAGG
jgi:very-short-patch-repair endonuclease